MPASKYADKRSTTGFDEKLPKALQEARDYVVAKCKKAALDRLHLERARGRWYLRGVNNQELLARGTASQVAKVIKIWAAGYCIGKANKAKKRKTPAKKTTGRLW